MQWQRHGSLRQGLLTSKPMGKKDELLDKSGEKLQPAAVSQSGQHGQASGSGGGSAMAAKNDGSDRPSIIPETIR